MRFREMLEEAKVVKNGHFLLSSGRHSNVYINKDSIFSNPLLFQYVKDVIMSHTLDDISNYDVVTGPAIAGSILAAPIAMSTGLIFVYPEKVTKTCVNPKTQNVFEHPNGMQFRRGYDKVISGKRILLIEDIITTGGSVQQTIDAATECGGTVKDVISIWNRSGWKPKTCSVFSIINDKVESWDKEDCPDCQNGIPLTDPKTDEVI